MRSSSKKETADVARHELIGLDVIVESPHAGFDGIRGVIVDETKHMLCVERASGSGEVRIPKPGQHFQFLAGEAWVRLRGDDITFRPEDRTKKFKINR